MTGTIEITARKLLRQLVDAAISAADPADVLARHLPDKPAGRCIVVGAGKSAAAMARAVEAAWPDVDLSGLVVTRYGHAVSTDRIEVREAAHPVPDSAGQAATAEILAAVTEAKEDDLVLALISGGGSALLAAPVPPLTLDDKIDITQRLLASGLPIGEMNQLRRRLSLIKGGGLARAAAPARLVTLAISDVPGDDPMAIASGPTVPCPDTEIDLARAMERLGPNLPDRVVSALSDRRTWDTPAPAGDYRLVATPQMSLERAAQVAKQCGIMPVILGGSLEGEAREMGIVMAGIARAVGDHATPAQRPAVLLSGGETTVTIGDRKPGRGGRNTEFLLSMAIALRGMPCVHAVAVDTDGIDGTEDAAGAVIDPTTLQRARDAGCDPGHHLAGHDSYSLFNAIDDLIRTGPTLTNVNDFRAVLIQ
ncbi:glycerate kinase type-2 family protein [Roseinatronobacter alkalisoli]|uniref:Glycerate kinase n=1 Tax=Roseinatronobacter alkalisoli TaxID=3028235 RepID=A0ABT5TDT4_9RHOB|nr:glycerate kinase [Roseinatronobacter sp. HJB301]MDD7973288.1 glycerate kinase [Roseinatronobacter sp. HJB301]